MATRKEKGLANKRKAIAIVRPQQHVREKSNEPEEKTGSGEQDQPDNTGDDSTRKSSEVQKEFPEKFPTSSQAPSNDREARFSLYDFPSDSETEEKLSSGKKLCLRLGDFLPIGLLFDEFW